MAQYTINHTCGHSAVHRLFGKHVDRERTIKYREQDVCPDCYKAQQAAKIDAASVGLPELTGSEKQIAWARKIRVKCLADIDAFGVQHKPNAERWTAAKAHLAVKTSSSFWIDNNDATVLQIMTLAAKEMQA